MVFSENRFPSRIKSGTGIFGIMRAGDGGLSDCGLENPVGKPALAPRRPVDCLDSGTGHHSDLVPRLTVPSFESGQGRMRPLRVDTAATGDRSGLVFGQSSHKLGPASAGSFCRRLKPLRKRGRAHDIPLRPRDGR
jgi:hypothetical protein